MGVVSAEVAQDLSDDEEGEEGERGSVMGEAGEEEGREKRPSPEGQPVVVVSLTTDRN